MKLFDKSGWIVAAALALTACVQAPLGPYLGYVFVTADGWTAAAPAANFSDGAQTL